MVWWLHPGGCRSCLVFTFCFRGWFLHVGAAGGLLNLRGQVGTWSCLQWRWCGVWMRGLMVMCVVAVRPSVSTPTPVVPHKFLLPHVVVSFGAGGQLVLVCPHHPAKGQLACVELHSLEVPQTTLGSLPAAAPSAPSDANTICHPNSLLSHFSVPCCCLISSPIKSRVCTVLARAWALLSAFGPCFLLHQLHKPCVDNLFTVIPSDGDRHGPCLSKGQICSPFSGALIWRLYPSPEPTTAFSLPVLPPKGGKCHLNRRFFPGPYHGGPCDGLRYMLWGYLKMAQRTRSPALLNLWPRH